MAFDPFSPSRLRRGASCGHILVYYLSQCPGEHHMPPPGIFQITSFEAFTIGLGEIVARVAIKQLIFGFAEPIIFGLVAEIFILERGLFRRGEFSQQIAFDQIFLAVYELHNDRRLFYLYSGRIRNFHDALFDFLLAQRVTHSSSLSRVRLARLNSALSEMPSLAANILRSSILARPSSW